MIDRVAAYDTEPWTDLFVTVGGASAALAGLLFVAVSLNLEHVLQYRNLPGVARQAVAALIALVTLSVLTLTPGQSLVAYGWEVLALGLSLAAIVLVPAIRGLRRAASTGWSLTALGTGALCSVPMIVAGVSLLAHAGGGMYWTLAEVISAVVVSAFDAWVLLVEIRR